jgi:hypothetical protein
VRYRRAELADGRAAFHRRQDAPYLDSASDDAGAGRRRLREDNGGKGDKSKGKGQRAEGRKFHSQN